jgi:methionyl aminopeptidase
MDDYIDSYSHGIKIHAPEDFAGMRAAGQLAASCLDSLVGRIEPGTKTSTIDQWVREFVLDHGALSATIFYKGYQHAVCISPNHVVCHGMPSDRALNDGDIANIDVTVIKDGWHGDTSRMFEIGQVSPKAKRLVDITYEAMRLGLETIKPGSHFGDIGHAIQSYAESHRCSVVRDFCGHGLGRVFHDAPNVLHFGRKGTGPQLREGMFFTVEPMINLGRADCRLLSDGWTAVTRDKSLSAQVEHSIGVTATGIEIFTASPAGLYRPSAPEI